MAVWPTHTMRLEEPTPPPSVPWFAKLTLIVNAMASSGTRTERPTKFKYPGRPYFDTSLGADGRGMMIYCDADCSGWVDGTGSVVPHP